MLRSLLSALIVCCAAWTAHADTLSRADPAAYAPYEARAIASQYAAIFDRLASVIRKAA